MCCLGSAKSSRVLGMVFGSGTCMLWNIGHIYLFILFIVLPEKAQGSIKRHAVHLVILNSFSYVFVFWRCGHFVYAYNES